MSWIDGLLQWSPQRVRVKQEVQERGSPSDPARAHRKLVPQANTEDAGTDADYPSRRLRRTPVLKFIGLHAGPQ